MKAFNSTLNVRREKPRRKSTVPPAGEGAAILHPGPFRSEELRALAAKAPRCMACGKANDGTVVLAHSNHLRDGKGTSIKAHDVPCYVCMDCHREIDLHGDETRRFNATYASMVWLLESGYLRVVEVAA